MRVACAGAKRNQACPKRVTTRRDCFEAAKASFAFRRVGMKHVEGAGDRGDFDVACSRGVGNAFGQIGWDLFRDTGQTSAGEIELDAMEAVRRDGIEYLLDCW